MEDFLNVWENERCNEEYKKRVFVVFVLYFRLYSLTASQEGINAINGQR